MHINHTSLKKQARLSWFCSFCLYLILSTALSTFPYETVMNIESRQLENLTLLGCSNIGIFLLITFMFHFGNEAAAPFMHERSQKLSVSLCIFFNAHRRHQWRLY